MRTLEGEWIEAERTVVTGQAREVPRTPDAFADWFQALSLEGPGRGNPLLEWVAERATLDQVHWFLQQELVTEAGVDVLVALTCLRVSPRRMGEWPGGGQPGRAPPLESAGQDTVWEALAVSNLLVGLASNRRYAWHAVGALAAAEIAARDRTGSVERALRRLGVGRNVRAGARPDRVRDGIVALLEEDAARAPFLAEGALLRLRAGLRCIRRYRSELEVRDPETGAD
jgi:heme oxygenase-like protein